MSEIQNARQVPAGGMHAIPLGLWLVIAAAIVGATVLLHPLLPRYDVRVTGENGSAVLIHDKWTGRVQRANYTNDGEPVLKGVVTPF
jgi:hypothetical protein